MMRLVLAALLAAVLPWAGASIVPTQTTATIVRDGAPYFIWGAAFFYDRIPRERWTQTLALYKRYGITTIDLYIPWNWHETADGVFDFEGASNPRRDLRGLLRAIDADGFTIVVRPGPVIRNEWRNGGYPAWLLTQPAYDMPLHDILEGRYPATATLQNAHSDDAAAEWMRNVVHMRYAERWLHRVAAELQPFAHDVVAWQLDDDQAAYIDNQTWPAPHLQAYLDRLDAIVRADVGPTLPLFINTYEMKVTASAPVLAFGNWYESEAYAFGDHDRTELAFATALLQTQPHAPIVASEFQAGWLQGAGDAYTRAVDPANTQLALHTLLQLGAHGVIDFPLQDTIAPAGWEAPFANAFYDWDAALDADGEPSARSAPTQAFGADITRYGTLLARAHRVTDAAIVWPVSAYDENAITNEDIFSAVARTKDALRFCRLAQLTCDLVDLRYADDARLAAYPILLLPQRGARLPLRTREALRLARYGVHDVVETDAVPFPGDVATARARADALLARAHETRAVDGIPDAVVLATDDATPHIFLDIVNIGDVAVSTIRATRRGSNGARIPIAAVTVPGRAARLVQLAGAPPAPHVAAPSFAPPHDERGFVYRDDVVVPFAFPSPDPHTASRAYDADIFADGYPDVVLENDRIRALFSPHAGARLVGASALDERVNHVTTVGGLRDDVSIAEPPSARDYIAKYTHDYPAGFADRPYAETHVTTRANAAAVFAYTAPDVVGGPVAITRTVTLAPHTRTIAVETQAVFAANAPAAQRLTTRSSLAGGPPASRDAWRVYAPTPQPLGPDATMTPPGNGFVVVGTDGRATAFSWPRGEPIAARLYGRNASIDVLLTLPTGTAHYAITLGTVHDQNDADTMLNSDK